MGQEEFVHEGAGIGERLILVLAFPNRTELVEWTDPDRRQRLCEAHRRSVRAMGVICLTASGTFTTEVLAPYSEYAAKRYLERIARDLATSSPRTVPTNVS